MTKTVEAIRREITVPVGRRRAFEVFTAEMTSWWPPAHHIGSAPIQDIVIEPRTGGRWFTRHQDGSETSTGFVQVWDPPSRLVLTWQIGADWHYHDDLVTTVDVRFEAEAEDLTRVLLEHGGFDAFGSDAAAMYQIFDAPDAWNATLAAFGSGAGLAPDASA